MSRIAVIFTIFMAFLLGSAGAVSAQSVSVADAAEAALDADPEDLVEGLEERPDDSLLPEGFENPSSGTPENQELVDSFSGGLGEVDDAVGQVTYGFDTDPDVVPGAISAGILTFIVGEEELTSDDLDDYQSGMEEGIESDTSGMDATVDRIEVDGEDAVQLDLSVEEGGFTVQVTMISIPVGNTMVVSTVFSADQEVLEAGALDGFTEDLALAGVGHVAEVAEDAQ
jgi:hypothetical protein